MQVIAIASPKGGSGKTTLASALAVRAAMESKRVAMFDLNCDQGNLTQWWVLRGEPMNPRLIEVKHITRDVEVLRASRFEWLIIDTPPLELDIIENAVLKADCVLIPVRASIFDIGSITPVVEMCRERHKPYAFVLSAVDSRFKKLTERAMAALVSECPICPPRPLQAAGVAEQDSDAAIEGQACSVRRAPWPTPTPRYLSPGWVD